MLLLNGRMEGTWSCEDSGEHLRVTIEPFVALPLSLRQAAEAEAERVAGFLGKKAVEVPQEGEGL